LAPIIKEYIFPYCNFLSDAPELKNLGAQPLSPLLYPPALSIKPVLANERKTNPQSVGRESTRRAAKPKRIPPFGFHLGIILVLLLGKHSQASGPGIPKRPGISAKNMREISAKRPKKSLNSTALLCYLKMLYFPTKSFHNRRLPLPDSPTMSSGGTRSLNQIGLEK
jgi:hypothetical protein